MYENKGYMTSRITERSCCLLIYIPARHPSIPCAFPGAVSYNHMCTFLNKKKKHFVGICNSRRFFGSYTREDVYSHPGGGGGTRMARGGIRLVHGLTKSTLITYFSGMKKDPKYVFLHAFFLICLSCSFQNLSM